MFWLSIISGLSLIIFVVYGLVCSNEVVHRRRIFLTGFRNSLDKLLISIYNWFNRKVTYVGKYIITLSWYYSLHAFLIVVLKSLARLYTLIESVVIKNRDRAKKIRVEKRRSHLTEIAEHREATALSPKEKAKRRKTSLEGR